MHATENTACQASNDAFDFPAFLAGYKSDISAFMRDEYFGAHNLHRFQQMWEQLCEEGIALKISYEDCHADFESVLRRLLEYYGFESPAEEIHSAAEYSSFENMRQLELSGEFPEPWLRPRNGAPKVRRGRVGGYREVLGADDIAFLDAVFTGIPTALSASSVSGA